MGASGGPDIVTDGLVLCLDAADKISYSGSGTTWSDLVGGIELTKEGSPTWSSDGYFSVGDGKRYIYKKRQVLELY